MFKRVWRAEWLAEREAHMSSRPATSMKRVWRSMESGLPRREPMAFWKRDSVVGSASLRSRIWRRDCFVASISWADWRPAARRLTVASLTGRGRDRKVCQAEETEAKPEREDMTDIPMTPMRRREPSPMDWIVDVDDGASSSVVAWPGRKLPLHQKLSSQTEKKNVSKIHSNRILPLLFPTNSGPVPVTKERISRRGIAMMRSMRRRDMVA